MRAISEFCLLQVLWQGRQSMCVVNTHYRIIPAVPGAWCWMQKAGHMERWCVHKEFGRKPDGDKSVSLNAPFGGH